MILRDSPFLVSKSTLCSKIFSFHGLILSDNAYLHSMVIEKQGVLLAGVLLFRESFHCLFEPTLNVTSSLTISKTPQGDFRIPYLPRGERIKQDLLCYNLIKE